MGSLIAIAFVAFAYYGMWCSWREKASSQSPPTPQPRPLPQPPSSLRGVLTDPDGVKLEIHEEKL